MKTKCCTTYRIFLIALILSGFSFGIPQSAFAKVFQVAIVPFKVNAEKDLSYLKDGIVDMLSSRLYWEGKVNIINRQAVEKASANVGGPLNETKAREMGTRLGADYVLFGSLTVFGNSVSIDTKMVDVSGKKQTLSFFNQSQGMDQVIPGIDLFASDINEKVFARAMPAQKVPVASQTPQAQADVREHPEKLVVGGFSENNPTSPQKTSPGQGFITTQGNVSPSGGFWKSQNFKNLINGLALGDVDGDGKIETVLITPNEVQIYRSENKRLVNIKDKIAESSYQNLIGVDVADINRNGKAEIFVTSLNTLKTNVNSFVLEYDGQNFKKIVEESYWYYRVVKLPERGKVLFGQRQEGMSADPFSGAIYEMVWKDADYVPENKVLPPRHANLMGFTFGNAMNNGQDVAVVYDKFDYIRIIQPSGETVWTSGERFGGGTLKFTLPKIEQDSENILYLPMCIRIADINADGKYEVIAARNHDVTKRMLERFRDFNSSQFEVLSWDGLGLASVWETRKISGYIRDFDIGDFNNDGKAELVAAVIMKEGTVVTTTPKSSLIAYELK